MEAFLGFGFAGFILLFVLFAVLNTSLQRVEAHTNRRLAAVERKLAAVMDHLGISEPTPEYPEVVRHLDEGRKIQAIRAYRESTGSGLAKAKNAVDEIARARGL